MAGASHDNHYSVKLQWQHTIACQLSSLLGGCISPDLICDSMALPKQSKHGQYALPLDRIHSHLKQEPWCSQTATEVAQWIVAKLTPSETIEKATQLGTFVNITIPRANYMKAVLKQVIETKTMYGFGTSTFLKDEKKILSCALPQLPDVFDANHFRGLVIATFLQRAYRLEGCDVRLTNTMTVWNDNFGYLALAFGKYGDPDGKDDLSSLNQIYLRIKQEAVEDESIHDQARQCLLQLEQGQEAMIKVYQALEAIFTEEYSRLLEHRLPFSFDTNPSTQQPWQALTDLYQHMERSTHVIKTSDGEWKIDLEGRDVLLRDRHGISTQLTRDLLHHASTTYHIAGQHHTCHLHTVRQTLAALNLTDDVFCHILFGKVKQHKEDLVACLDGLKQTIVEIIEENEGTEKYDAMMAQLGQLSATTRTKMTSDPQNNNSSDLMHSHADRLGVCIMFIDPLTLRRNKPMSFSSHPDVFGNSGVFLQFVHSRLCGIERQCDVTLDTAVVDHDEAFEVFDAVAQFPYVMHQALATMEPSLLVTYLFKLARTTNQALYRLRIKGAPPHLANPRWTLFWAAKQTLANGLAVLGLEAVSRM